MSQHADFRDSRNFPTFKEIVAGGAPLSRTQCCLLAEIDGYLFPNWVRLKLHDRSGTKFNLSIMAPGIRNDPSQFKVGSTIAVINPRVQAFIDMNAFDIRESGDELLVSENANFVVFPTNLNNFMSINNELRARVTSNSVSKTCDTCGSQSDKLLKCARCLNYQYCNADCQRLGWHDLGHHRDCKILRSPQFKALLELGNSEEPFRFPH